MCSIKEQRSVQLFYQGAANVQNTPLTGSTCTCVSEQRCTCSLVTKARVHHNFVQFEHYCVTHLRCHFLKILPASASSFQLPLPASTSSFQLPRALSPCLFLGRTRSFSTLLMARVETSSRLRRKSDPSSKSDSTSDSTSDSVSSCTSSPPPPASF